MEADEVSVDGSAFFISKPSVVSVWWTPLIELEKEQITLHTEKKQES